MASKLKSRIFNIMQYENHPETGEKLIDENQIKAGLNHKTIGRYAYICHDRDVYSQDDEEANPEHIQGEKKPRHWHIAIEMKSNQIEIGTIAKWFGIKDNYVNVAKGAGAFLDCVKYLTHEDEKQQDLGKTLYEDIEVIANFDFRTALDERAMKKAKYGRDVSEKEAMLYDVAFKGKTLRQCQAENPLLYIDIIDKLKKMRLEYINSNVEPPKMRMNYYITGKGGAGKGLLSRALARSLCPADRDEDIFFEVGSKNALFEGYDGQPVIIWNDRRAFDLLQELGGRNNVFNVFDTFPTRQRQNIKYSSVNLCNKINIVNSVQPFGEFLDGLAGEYKDKSGEIMRAEDKGQSRRRFPFILVLHEEDMDMLLNKGFMENSGNYIEYIEYCSIIGNMQRIAAICQGNETLRKELEAKVVKSIVDKHHSIEDTKQQEVDADKIREMFSNVGTVKPIPKQMEIGFTSVPLETIPQDILDLWEKK